MEAISSPKRRVKKRDEFNGVGRGVGQFIQSEQNSFSPSDFCWTDTADLKDIELLPADYEGYGNLQRINDIPRINKFLEKANRSLHEGDYFLICLETIASRKVRILNKFPRYISRPYYVLDFILKRLFPKWKITRKIYFKITKGRNRTLSLTEAFGRLISCGFEIAGHQRIGYKTYILSRKKNDPVYDMDPTYGAVVKLQRIGKDGELMDVYKLRTMHPYSEYVQAYAFEKNSLQDGGKINDDFRITSWGRFFRKLWLDELPMFINFFKGEMKLVGVRPLSPHYFSLYPVEAQNLRIKVKPGLVPPFYADMPETIEEIVESERAYIESYLEKPIRTDIQYFFKAMHNIFIKRARSA